MLFNKMHTCRVCLADKANIGLFECEDGILQTFHKIMACSTVKIFKGDGLPDNICNVCENNLNISYNFKILCETSDISLRKCLLIERDDNYRLSPIETIKVEIIEEQDFEHAGGTTNDQIKEDIKDILKWQNLEHKDSSNTLNIHSNIKSPSPPFQPDYETEVRSKRHSENVGVNSICDILNVEIAKQDKKRKTYKKNQKANIISKLKKSNRKERPEIQQKPKREYRKKGSEPLKCDHCSQTFTSNSKLVRHTRWHTGERPYECMLCEKRYPIAFLLTVHMRSHTGYKPYVCDTCGKSFIGKGGLNKHVKTHIEKHLQCTSCPKRFSNCELLQAHEAQHNRADLDSGNLETRKFKCEQCGRGFKHKYVLRTHLQTHSVEKQHVCEMCGRGCATLDLLQNHIRTHTGERPYKCKDCNACFIKKGQLKEHYVGHHTDAKPYSCKLCDQKFSFPSSLRGHVQRHHSTDVKIHKCKWCLRVFNYSSGLSRHMKADHK